jgi:hypothetical protein
MIPSSSITKTDLPEFWERRLTSKDHGRITIYRNTCAGSVSTGGLDAGRQNSLEGVEEQSDDRLSSRCAYILTRIVLGALKLAR